MQDFLNKVGKHASKAANMAGNKATEMLEVTKLKSKLSDIKEVQRATKKEIGEYCYDLYKEGNVTDTHVINLCKKIDAAVAAADEIERQIEKAKAEFAAKNESPDPSLND